MKTLKLKLSPDEFRRYPIPFGWKAEYLGGIAYLSPFDTPQLLKRGVCPMGCSLPENTCLVPVADTDRAALIRLYVAAYADAPEFCDWPKKKIMATASQDLGACLASDKHGTPKPTLSKALVVNRKGNKPKLAAACVVNRCPYGHKLTLLFVHPKHQGQGLATALVSNLINQLDRERAKELYTECAIGNTKARNWYLKFGFEIVPDLMTAKMVRGYYIRELQRQELLGDAEREARLRDELRQANAEVDRLEALMVANPDAVA
jgi:ribosomal protein S18 acetylase RimI-like enzyme